MIYFFFGVAIVADRFMDSIEMITSQEKTILIQKEDGQRQEVQVRKIENITVIIINLMTSLKY